ncbi:Alpha/Beta hydrolase protein [Limtongia smithiae]|uniref:Alpha/Beta hydrolase protein n=1 Tax=Limtongia smithiae TaxID=1125753 RepID=UPI0034CFFC27
MEQLPALGTEILSLVRSTTQIYTSLIITNAKAILATRKETYFYGSNRRQVLDVYYPTASSDLSSAPILIFFYGGGLVRGDRIIESVPDGLVYANLGHFFSHLGYITIIPDYRLVPEAKFPSGGEDVAAALHWTEIKFGSSRSIYLMGNSAGGVHVSTFLLADEMKTERSTFIRASGGVKGAVLVSVPYSFRNALADRADILRAYFGSDVEVNAPLSLIRAWHKSGRALPVPMLVMVCSLDPEDEIIEPTTDFTEICKSIAQDKSAMNSFKFELIDGHNHISPVLGVGTAIEKEERWGVIAHEWMRNCS